MRIELEEYRKVYYDIWNENFKIIIGNRRNQGLFQENLNVLDILSTIKSK